MELLSIMPKLSEDDDCYDKVVWEQVQTALTISTDATRRELHDAFLEMAAVPALERMARSAKTCARFNDVGPDTKAGYLMFADEQLWRAVLVKFSSAMDTAALKNQRRTGTM